MNIKLLTAAAALGLCTSTPLLAETIRVFDLGDLSNLDITFPVFTPGLGDFRDDIFFTVVGAGAGFGGAATLVIDDPLVDGIETNFSITSVELLDSSLASLALDTDGSDGFSLFAVLPSAGQYRFSVAGTVTGTVNGAYEGFILTRVETPVPEPETYGLFLAGLGLAAASLRGRRSSSPTTV